MIAGQFELTTGGVGGSLTVRLVWPPVLERSHPFVSSLKGSSEETHEKYCTVQQNKLQAVYCRCRRFLQILALVHIPQITAPDVDFPTNKNFPSFLNLSRTFIEILQIGVS